MVAGSGWLLVVCVVVALLVLVVLVVLVLAVWGRSSSFEFAFSSMRLTSSLHIVDNLQSSSAAAPD